MTAVDSSVTLEHLFAGDRVAVSEPWDSPRTHDLTLRDYVAGDVPMLRRALTAFKSGTALTGFGVMVAVASLLLALLLLTVGAVAGSGLLAGLAFVPLLLGVGLAGVIMWAGRAKATAARLMADRAGDPIRLAIAAYLRDMYGVSIFSHYLLPVFPLEERRILATGPDGDVRLAVAFEDLDSPVSVTVLGTI